MRFHLAMPAAMALAILLSPVSSTRATGAPPQGSANDTEILFLGTSPGPPLHTDRSKTGTLLIVDGREYLIDCGIGTIGRMVEAGIDSDSVRTIFLTHLHADHALGISDVMANDFFRQQGHRQWIDIYGPPETKELVDYAFRYLSVGFEPFAAESWPFALHQVNGAFLNPFRAHEFGSDGVVFQDDKVRVIAAENSHYALMPARYRTRLKSYSLRFETPHGIIVFTGDTGPTPAVIELARGADVLISEATYGDAVSLEKFVSSQAARLHWTPEQARDFRAHFESQHLDPEEVGEIAWSAGVKAVLLDHYSPADKADQAKYVGRVDEHFSGPVFTPDDLDRFCVSSATPGNSSSLRRC